MDFYDIFRADPKARAVNFLWVVTGVWTIKTAPTPGNSDSASDVFSVWFQGEKGGNLMKQFDTISINVSAGNRYTSTECAVKKFSFDSAFFSSFRSIFFRSSPLYHGRKAWMTPTHVDSRVVFLHFSPPPSGDTSQKWNIVGWLGGGGGFGSSHNAEPQLYLLIRLFLFLEYLPRQRQKSENLLYQQESLSLFVMCDVLVWAFLLSDRKPRGKFVRAANPRVCKLHKSRPVLGRFNHITCNPKRVSWTEKLLHVTFFASTASFCRFIVLASHHISSQKCKIWKARRRNWFRRMANRDSKFKSGGLIAHSSYASAGSFLFTKKAFFVFFESFRYCEGIRRRFVMIYWWGQVLFTVCPPNALFLRPSRTLPLAPN